MWQRHWTTLGGPQYTLLVRGTIGLGKPQNIKEKVSPLNELVGRVGCIAKMEPEFGNIWVTNPSLMKKLSITLISFVTGIQYVECIMYQVSGVKCQMSGKQYNVGTTR